MIFIRRYIVATLFETHLTAFADLAYRCGLGKRTLHFDNFSIKCAFNVGSPTLRGQKKVKHDGHQGISFLFIG